MDPAKRKAAPYLDDQYFNLRGQFRPGSAGAPAWVAYASNESTRGFEIFVQSYPIGAGKFQISDGGGFHPRWRRDGKELFYMAPDGKIMAADVKAGPRFEAGVPRVLFDTHITNAGLLNNLRYDVTADGQRFLVDLETQSGAAPQPITVVLNWLDAVKK